MKFLLDTNVFREIGKAKPHEHVSAWLDSVDDADLAISAITVREVAKGIAKLRASKPDIASALERSMSDILDAFEGRILSVDRKVAEDWGRMLAAREKHVDDTGIAATARAHGLTLVTRNTRDVIDRGVPLVNPFKSPPERLASPHATKASS